MENPVDLRTTGLILRTRRLTESSLIVHWLTADHGRLATVAKGARRPKSPLRGKLDLFFKAEFTFRRSRRSELHLLREVGVVATHAALRQDLARLQQAAYAAALVEQTTETDTPLPGIFALVDGLLAHLARQPAAPANVFAFEMKLLAELGLGPDLGKASLSPGTREVLRALSVADWAAVGRLRLSAAQTEEAAAFLQGFILFHLGRLAPGRRAALGRDVP